MKKSYGGVVINQSAQVLLREPRGHFDGYVWTFAKGEPNSGESVEETALREVREETGVEGMIIAEIPGSFRGSASENKYFLMVPTGNTRKFEEEETQSVKWVTRRQAEDLISKTLNPTGKIRDLLVLKAAFEALQRKSES